MFRLRFSHATTTSQKSIIIMEFFFYITLRSGQDGDYVVVFFLQEISF